MYIEVTRYLTLYMIVDFIKLKVLADDMFRVVKMIVFVFKNVGNVIKRRGNAYRKLW